MEPSMTSFADELVKISWERPSSDELKDLAKNVGVYGAGLGVGGGLGYAARKKLLPYLLQHMGPKQVTALTVGTGALGGLAGARAISRVLSPKQDDSES